MKKESKYVRASISLRPDFYKECKIAAAQRSLSFTNLCKKALYEFINKNLENK